MSPGISRCWLLMSSLMLSACTALSFGVANLPSYLSRTQRTGGVAFGEDARQRLDIYRPATSDVAARPVIVFWYGGGWTGGARQDYRFVGVALAQLGYLAVLPDYRLYPQVRFPQFLDDGAQAVAWVQRHAADYGGDPQRIVLMGHSAGAYMAAMLALNRRYLTQAGADPQRIVGLIGLSGPYGLTPNTATLHEIFRVPYTPRDWQVLPYVSGQAPPALLLHGRSDTLVWPSNTEQLAAALRTAGVPVDTMIYDNRGHVDMLAALSVPARARAPVLRQIADFMRALPITASTPARTSESNMPSHADRAGGWPTAARSAAAASPAEARSTLCKTAGRGCARCSQ
jgi:acetyl esterase/lipase